MFSVMSLCCMFWMVGGGQFTGNSQDWATLAGDSATVIVGVAEKQLAVVHHDKMVTHSKPLPDGKVLVELPNRDDYMEGRVVRIHVIEVLKRDAKVRPNGVISIFVPGASLTDLSPAFEEGEHYLLFLSRLPHNPERFAGATIHHDEPSTWEEPFTSTSQYRIVGSSGGIVHLTDENKKLIDQVRALLMTASG